MCWLCLTLLDSWWYLWRNARRHGWSSYDKRRAYSTCVADACMLMYTTADLCLCHFPVDMMFMSHVTQSDWYWTNVFPRDNPLTYVDFFSTEALRSIAGQHSRAENKALCRRQSWIREDCYPVIGFSFTWVNKRWNDGPWWLLIGNDGQLSDDIRWRYSTAVYFIMCQ